jgi:hypothetical protein
MFYIILHEFLNDKQHHTTAGLIAGFITLLLSPILFPYMVLCKLGIL